MEHAHRSANSARSAAAHFMDPVDRLRLFALRRVNTVDQQINTETIMSTPTRVASADATEQLQLNVEFLYLDLSACGRCQGTEHTLDQALLAVTAVLTALNISVNVAKVHVTSEAQAEVVGLIASPTIRINGIDIQPGILQSPCEDCGNLCGCAGGCVNCRKWHWQGRDHTAAPIGLIVEAIMAAALATKMAPTGPASRSGTASLPENLKLFFQGVEQQQNGTCCSTLEGQGCQS